MSFYDSVKLGDLFKKKSSHIPLGLDIGNDFVKLVEIRESSGGKRLLNFAIAKIAPSADESSRLQAISQAVKKVKEEVCADKMQPREVVLSISDSRILYKDLRLPAMPQKELQKAVRLQVGRMDASLVKNATVDFHVLYASEDEKGTKLVDLIIAAVANEVIDKYLSIVKKTGLRPVGVGLKQFAIAEYFKMQAQQQQKDTVALINISSKRTNVMIMQGQNMHFLRQIELGGDSFTRAISEDLELDFDRAEELKIQYALQWQEEPEEEIERKLSISIRPILEHFLVEIERSLGYYTQQFSKAQIKKVILYGGGAVLRNFDKFLAKQLGADVEICGPPSDLIQSGASAKTLSIPIAQLAAAIGLTQSGVIEKVNLLPPKIAELKNSLVEAVIKRDIVKAAVPVLVPLLLIGYFGLKVAAGLYQGKIESVKDRIKGLEEEVIYAQKILKSKDLMQEKAALVTQIEQRLFWSSILRDISKSIIIDNIWLRGMHFLMPVSTENNESGVLKIWGSAFSRSLVSDYIARLSRSKYFDAISLVSTKEATRYNYKIIDFELSCKLRRF